MKAKELAAILLRYPEAEVQMVIDHGFRTISAGIGRARLQDDAIILANDKKVGYETH